MGMPRYCAPRSPPIHPSHPQPHPIPNASPAPAVRGYNVGELAAARRYVEAAAELRVPVLGQQLFAFAEYGSDLGSSGEQLFCVSAFLNTACSLTLLPVV